MPSLLDETVREEKRATKRGEIEGERRGSLDPTRGYPVTGKTPSSVSNPGVTSGMPAACKFRKHETRGTHSLSLSLSLSLCTSESLPRLPLSLSFLIFPLIYYRPFRHFPPHRSTKCLTFFSSFLFCFDRFFFIEGIFYIEQINILYLFRSSFLVREILTKITVTNANVFLFSNNLLLCFCSYLYLWLPFCSQVRELFDSQSVGRFLLLQVTFCKDFSRIARTMYQSVIAATFERVEVFDGVDSQCG